MAGLFFDYSFLLDPFQYAAEVFGGDTDQLGDLPMLQWQSDLHWGLFSLGQH